MRAMTYTPVTAATWNGTGLRGIFNGMVLLLLMNCFRGGHPCPCRHNWSCALGATTTLRMDAAGAPARAEPLWPLGRRESGRSTAMGNECRAHTCPMAGSVKLLPQPLPPGWTPTTPVAQKTVTLKVQRPQHRLMGLDWTPMSLRADHRRGLPQPWSYVGLAWRRPETTSWVCCVYRCPPPNCSPADSREAGWERCADDCRRRTGKLFALPQHSTWRASSSHAGEHMSGEVHMNADPGVQPMQRAPKDSCTPRCHGRPRSLCSRQHQLLAFAHPFGPSLARLRRSHPKPATSPTRPLTCRCSSHSNQPRNGARIHRACCMDAAAGRGPGSTAGSVQFRPNLPKSQEPYMRKFARHPRPCYSRAGPKSGACLQLLVLTHLSKEVGGVKVASASAAEAGPGSAELGKHRGPVLGAPPSHALKPKTSEKRAYRRARLRAMQNGGTYYRGRWHTLADLRVLEYTPTPPLPRSLRAKPRRRQARLPPVPCLSWNAGGLSSAVYQEFMAWLEGQSKFQIIMLQETHWPQSSDYTSGHWMCVHSASDPAEAHDSYAGVMIMLSKKHFRDPAVHEIHRGRVLHVRATHVTTNTTVDILVVYQHVWRSHLTAQRNHELRDGIWQHLHTACAKIPARHFLLVGGDFNASVRPKRHEAGPASMPSKANPQDPQLNRLLTAHNLCALNTWGARPAYTHYSHTGKTQIDYVLTRCATAGQTSKMAKPLINFPVAGWRQAGHLPIQATLSIVP